jgi:dihydrofolate synthase/folylpolyglutamate synthase
MLSPRYQTALQRIVRPIAAADLPATLLPMQRLLNALGHPEVDGLRITVAGSVGKGTTALALTRALAGTGRRVGLYTSPHMHSFRERICIDGEMISQEDFAQAAECVLDAAQAIGLSLSTFEAATAAALCTFAAARPDVQVCEIGLGGRFDAVNAAPHALAVITPIEMEHAAMLGGTLQSIAWHKAGILRPGGLALSLPQQPQVAEVLHAQARALGGAVQFVADVAELTHAALHHLALQAVGPDRSARWQTALPGRLERFDRDGKPVLIDGAHTPLGAARLARALAALGQPVGVALAFLQDKRIHDCLNALDLPGAHLIVGSLEGPRALPAQHATAGWAPQHASLQIAPDFAPALALALAHPAAAIGGSLRAAALAREALGLLSPALLEESRWTRALFSGPGYRPAPPPRDP